MRLNEIDLTQRTLITEGWNDPRLTLLEHNTLFLLLQVLSVIL